MGGDGLWRADPSLRIYKKPIIKTGTVRLGPCKSKFENSNLPFAQLCVPDKLFERISDFIELEVTRQDIPAASCSRFKPCFLTAKQ